MSERDNGRDGSRDTSGDWTRLHRNPNQYTDWGPDHRTTTDPKVKPKAPVALPKDVRFIDEATWDSVRFSDDVQAVAKMLTDLLIKKHKDYGPLNIALAPGGALNGLRVRIHDKTARINHLIDSGANPENESLRDSFADLANYAIISLLVLDNRWPTK